jgi:hypothetical protein
VLLEHALPGILQLDIAQENRRLSKEERELRDDPKKRVISLAIIEQVKKSTRKTSIKDGDASTKNARRRKNHIHCLKRIDGWVTEHEKKEKIIYDHFASVMGRRPTRNEVFNWESLPLSNVDIEGINDPSRRKRCLKQ